MRPIRARSIMVVMGDTTGIETSKEGKAADPYGDVALGVECAWPPQELFAAKIAEESAE